MSSNTTLPLVVAIDGVLGSGKSTVARLVAQALDIGYLDTGAMYRAIGLAASRKNVDSANIGALTELATTSVIDVANAAVGPARVVLDGDDVTVEIRTAEAAKMASAVATIPGVRAELVRRQREWVSARGGGVLEGRDIATVVFPDAAVKVFLTASIDERVRRRHLESPEMTEQQVRDDLIWRDGNDASRAADPLRVADGATVIDTTGVAIDDVVATIVRLATSGVSGE